jgi:hypothetical protein
MRSSGESASHLDLLLKLLGRHVAFTADRDQHPDDGMTVGTAGDSARRERRRTARRRGCSAAVAAAADDGGQLAAEGGEQVAGGGVAVE